MFCMNQQKLKKILTFFKRTAKVCSFFFGKDNRKITEKKYVIIGYYEWPFSKHLFYLGKDSIAKHFSKQLPIN